MTTRCVVILTAASSIFFCGARANSQNVLYQHSFTGSGGLNGATVDVNNVSPGGTWLAADLFGNNGSVAAGTGNNSPEGGAYLPFVPADGAVYTLEASVLHNSDGWIGLGFARAINLGNLNVPQARHAQESVDGYAWMLTRNNPTGNDQETFTGPWATNAYLGGDFADPTQVIDMKVVLDTTAGVNAWTAEYFFNGSSIGPPDTIVFDGVDSINYVGISRDIASGTGTAAGSILSFSLTTTEVVFDPADVNEDGFVNENDYFIIRDNLFETAILGIPVQKGDGDILVDGIVDFADFRLWKDTAPIEALIAAGFAVPEPSSATLATLLGLTVTCRCGGGRRLRRRAG